MPRLRRFCESEVSQPSCYPYALLFLILLRLNRNLSSRFVAGLHGIQSNLERERIYGPLKDKSRIGWPKPLHILYRSGNKKNKFCSGGLCESSGFTRWMSICFSTYYLPVIYEIVWFGECHLEASIILDHLWCFLSCFQFRQWILLKSFMLIENFKKISSGIYVILTLSTFSIFMTYCLWKIALIIFLRIKRSLLLGSLIKEERAFECINYLEEEMLLKVERKWMPLFQCKNKRTS